VLAGSQSSTAALIATHFATALSISKEFLMNYLFYNGEGEKEMLKGQELEEVMDCFQYLNSLNIMNVTSSFR